MEKKMFSCIGCGVTFQKFKGTYQPCAPELDHIIPLSRGGGHVWSNVQCSCRDCNTKKNNKVIGQFRLAI